MQLLSGAESVRFLLFSVEFLVFCLRMHLTLRIRIIQISNNHMQGNHSY